MPNPHPPPPRCPASGRGRPSGETLPPPAHGRTPARSPLLGWAALLPVLFLIPAAIALRPSTGHAEEGETIESLRITGNRSISDRKIRQQMTTRVPAWYGRLPLFHPPPYQPERFADDVRRIEEFYRDSGYLGARVVAETFRKGNRVALAIRVEEGGLTRVQEVGFEGLDSLRAVTPDRLRGHLSLRGRRPFRRSYLEADKQAILKELQNQGHPYARVASSVRVMTGEGAASITFRVTPGPHATFGASRVEGNARVSARTILRGLDYRAGGTYRETRLISTQRLLYRSGAFRAVNVRPDLSDSTRTSVGIIVTVQERPFHHVRVGGGYDTEESVRGAVTWGHRNFLGGARALTVTGKASEILLEGQAGLQQPFAIDSRTDLGITAFARRVREPGFRGSQVGMSLGFSREFAEQVVGVLQHELKRIQAGRDTLLFNLRASFIRDRRNDIFDPQSGAFLMTSGEQVFVQSSKKFFRATVDGRWYRPVTRRLTLATRVFGGGIRGEIIPASEKFYAGGASSVRGWGLQELGPGSADSRGRFSPSGGKHKVEGSVEFRVRLPRRLGAAGFVDFGNVGDGLGTFDFGRYVFTVGGGIRYSSPIGPIRLDLGIKAKDPFQSAEAGMRGYNLHFSLGQAF